MFTEKISGDIAQKFESSYDGKTSYSFSFLDDRSSLKIVKVSVSKSTYDAYEVSDEIELEVVVSVYENKKFYKELSLIKN